MSEYLGTVGDTKPCEALCRQGRKPVTDLRDCQKHHGSPKRVEQPWDHIDAPQPTTPLRVVRGNRKSKAR